ncbi:hypothetical protein EDD21DRAFT_368119 [Dissophora ornata]|nr:hypothetical protein EDD21DRAFT_368119 [Dissophora ornata]
MGGYLGLAFWKVVSDLRLQSLSLNDQSTVDPDAMELFVKVCTGLRCLEVGGTRITDKDCLKHLTFPKMRRLTLDSVDDMKPMDQLDFFNRCPHLDSLTWHWSSTETGVSAEGQQFARQVAAKTWPDLERVDLRDQRANVQDEDIALILNSMVLARELGFVRSAFGPRAFEAMHRHFSALRVLKITNCRAVTSAMAQDILCSCPSLQDVKLGPLLAKHLVYGKPWVCLLLKTLQIRITFHAEENGLQPLVFQQLSRLVHLETLHIGGLEPGPYIRELDFRLQNGLGELASLKEMRRLQHKGTRQLLGVEEVEWIVAHWTKLKTVYGSLNMDPAINIALKGFLKSYGVHVPPLS